MVIPGDATHQRTDGKLYFKETTGGWYVYIKHKSSSTGKWNFMINAHVDELIAALKKGSVVRVPSTVDWTFAPKTATHADEDGKFYKFTGNWYVWSMGSWVYTEKTKCLSRH